ncbi:MAG: NFACT RNA binding domain-containing protein [Treponema sp.]
MSLNNKEISLILSELQLEGYYIQKITQPTHFSLILHLYKQNLLYLYINLLSGECRLHSIKNKMPKEEKMMRFVQLLRSRVIGTKIDEAFQLDENRIVILRLLKGTEEYHLIIKLWSNASNILLTDKEDTIIDVFYRRKGKEELAKKKFVPPEKRSGKNDFVVRSYDSNLSFNEAIEKEYNETSKKISRTALLEEVEHFFTQKIEKIESLIKKLEQKSITFTNAESLKHLGDLITSNIYLIKKGESSINVFDYETNQNVIIQLDPIKTPQENAKEYYLQYKKSVSGIEKIKDDILKWKKEIENLKTTFSNISLEADSVIILRLLEKEKQKYAQSNLKGENRQVGLKFIFEGWTILVGRSSKENDALLRHNARGNDTWLHTRDCPGGFVFIKSQGVNKSVPPNVLVAAGNLAVFYSKARRAGEADLYKTTVKNLRRAKNAPIGTVLPYHEKNIFIKIDSAIIEKLKPVE